MRPVALSLLLLIGSGTVAGAITLNIDGSFTFVLDQTNLSTANTPGLDYATQTSVTNTINLDITGAAGNWRVDVRRSYADLSADVDVLVRRTGNGTGAGTAPSGGSTFFTLTDVDQTFFTGNLDRANIQIRLRVIPRILYLNVKIYNIDIWLTVTDT